MNLSPKRLTILIANDRLEECFLLEEAFQEINSAIEIFFVKNGEELLDYLYCRGQYADSSIFPRPKLILLDLNMPKKDGRETLLEIKSHPKLRLIPVVVLTTSKHELDIFRCYELGVNSLIVRPLNFEGLLEAMKSLYHYWFEIVSLPPDRGDRSVENP